MRLPHPSVIVIFLALIVLNFTQDRPYVYGTVSVIAYAAAAWGIVGSFLRIRAVRAEVKKERNRRRVAR